MTNRIIQINSALANEDTIVAIAEKYKVEQFWVQAGEQGMKSYFFLIETSDSQQIIDTAATIIGHDDGAKIIVHAVEAVLPKRKGSEDSESKKKKKSNQGLSREELYASVSKGAELDSNFIFLVLFSTLVAGVGLIQDSPAVVIGAMVIAPMLGSNLALALGTALADLELSLKAIKTSFVGIGLTLLIAILIGYFLEIDLNNKEIMSRTTVQLDAIILALASGAAGVLSLTSGVSSVLVGVMVAVALLPPATVFGILLGNGNFTLAWGALILLAINVVCVNISANLVFLFKGIAPRSWYEKEKAKKKMRSYMAFWIILLAALAALVYYRNYYG